MAPDEESFRDALAAQDWVLAAEYLAALVRQYQPEVVLTGRQQGALFCGCHCLVRARDGASAAQLIGRGATLLTLIGLGTLPNPNFDPHQR
ncbi:hypothetical protein [Hymenobacter latericus]|uniref:hypothetical protein n=1 Tax=Hymenobacter sp. YIM 151858-1 TaxID=2987688 RepID=UPI002226D161|nr:hypothetical protein [Hymenobacter sp. YIM 151858-1]UYZ61145.1 hypothetical protein OIS50_19440 [Hymenobacter sp. YIM 151858-1]